MSDELDVIADDPEAQQRAVESSSGAAHFWKGKRLGGWSYERSTVFERLSVFGRGVTSNLEAAAAIVFLCLLEGPANEARMDSARDPESCKALRKEIAKWANEHKLSTHSPSGMECSRVAHAILTAAKQSEFEPIVEKKSPLHGVSEPATAPIISPPFPQSPTAA